MREIKFRGKRKRGTEWLFGDLNHIEGKVYIFDRSENTPANSTDWFEVDPETVGQFTGLLDKNGKEIWEGDILSYFLPDPASKKPDINYIDLVEYLTDRFECDTMPMSAINEDSEVIGNIHDNPDLLK